MPTYAEVMLARARQYDARMSGIVRRQTITHVQYARKANRSDGHSFSLLSTALGVESIEAWAGEDGYQLDQCLVQDRPQRLMTHDTAWNALGQLLSPVRATREAAFLVLSRADDLTAFSDNENTPREDMELTIIARQLIPQDQAQLAIDQKLQTTYAWYHEALAIHEAAVAEAAEIERQVALQVAEQRRLDEQRRRAQAL
jgi:hypothetical protein